MTDEKQAVDEAQKTIDKMTVKELRDVAKECEITGTSGMKKEELLACIKEAKGDVDKKPQAKAPKAVKKKASSAKKVPLTSAKACKTMISSLRKEKETAKANGDKNAAETLRRRINILKKKSRKFKKAV